MHLAVIMFVLSGGAALKLAAISLCVSSLFIGTAIAQKPVDVSEVGQDHFVADFPSGGDLRMRIRSGDIKVTGSDENKIQVHFSGKKADELKDVRVSLKANGTTGELSISGGPRNDFRIEIEVPKNCNLHLRVPFGDVGVAGITGDKDVEVHAGDVTIEVGKTEDYAHVDASVSSGDLEAEPFSVSKGGLFRSFEKQGPGKYHLHAHVGAGDLTFKQKS